MAASEKARAAIAIELAFSTTFAEIQSQSMVMVVLVPLADVLRSCVSNTPGKNSIVSYVRDIGPSAPSWLQIYHQLGYRTRRLYGVVAGVG